VGEKPEDWGVSGFVIIAESHIAIHTFPDHGYVWVDVFSCKEFETDGAIDVIVDAFGLAEAKTRLLERGLEYPHSVPDSVPLNRDERLAVAGSLADAG
jgi:S-adenosylmethionine decarboxylase